MPNVNNIMLKNIVKSFTFVMLNESRGDAKTPLVLKNIDDKQEIIEANKRLIAIPAIHLRITSLHPNQKPSWHIPPIHF